MTPDVINLVLPLVKVLLIDLTIGLTAWLVLGTLAKYKRAAYAVLKRNFLGYFYNPTGYVFLCLFVLLTSMAAFWPHEFFNSNLATLDQLNYWFPIIMLFFIPAITMSIWAEEKRQGTDELLLTLPADDFDIVIGKYLAAASIYTVSLLFSQLSTFLVLLFLSLGEVDTGLFFANYLGYWFIGLAMLAIGMIASFLTHNLTVGFILGAAFNAPLVFASWSDVIIPDRRWAEFLAQFSIQSQFDSFGRGVISAAPIVYFTLVSVFGIYMCMVLIGQRHWSGGDDSNKMFLHYLTRVVMLAVCVFSLSYFVRNNDRLRYDATEGKVSSLSPVTRKLLRSLNPDRPIVVEAFISDEIPQRFSKTRYDLLTLLKEFRALAAGGHGKLRIQIYDHIEPFGPEAQRAAKQYGIRPRVVRVRERGAFKDQEVILGAAVRSGLSKVVVPFFESGIPVEYELIRSITTVAEPIRRKLGIVNTDAHFMGGIVALGDSVAQLPKQPIVEELEKQYDVEPVDASSPIPVDAYDVLLVVQPSSLNPTEMSNLVDAIRAGIPTAIFEDPLPAMYEAIPGTGVPRLPNPLSGSQTPEPKGEIQQLWDALGINPPVRSGLTGIHPDIVWQQYNPHPKLQFIMNANDEWLFILEGPDEQSDYLSEKSPITAGLRELMFLYAGAIEPEDGRDDVEITSLVKTRGEVSGRIAYEDLVNQLRQGNPSSAQLRLLQGPPLGEQVLAALIVGSNAQLPGQQKGGNGVAEKKATGSAGNGEEALPNDSSRVRAVYVTDMDLMHEIFSESRKRPEMFEELDLRVQNIIFVLNVVDVLAGELDYPAIRTHEPRHVTLALFELQAEQFRQKAFEEQKRFQDEFNREKQAAEEEMQQKLAEFRDRLEELNRKGGATDANRDEYLRLQQQAQIVAELQNRKVAVKTQQLQIKRDRNIAESQRAAEAAILKLQNRYKMLAIFLPPIPPLLVGAGVFVTRRVREREGIAKSRRR